MKTSLRLSISLLLVLIMAGCMGQRQDDAQQKREAERRLLEQLDASGRRVVFRDQHGDVLGKWRLRRDHLKVYDEQMRPQGSVRVVRDDAGRFDHIEGRHHDGTLLTITPISSGDQTRYHFGDRLMLERQAEQWVLGQLDPFVILARITPGATSIRVQETRRNKNAVVRHVTSTAEPARHAQIEGVDGELIWRAPAKITREQLVPFALTHANLSPMERGMLAMFLAAHSPPEPSKEP